MQAVFTYKDALIIDDFRVDETQPVKPIKDKVQSSKIQRPFHRAAALSLSCLHSRKNLAKKKNGMYEGHSQIIDTPPFPNENESFIYQIEIQLFQGVHCEGWILL